MEQGIVFTGVPSPEELAGIPGFPTRERMERGPVAVIECVQEIPCNPCEVACPFGAIRVGEPITNLPCLQEDRCTGCGSCIAKCPGLAIFTVDLTYAPTEAAVSFPYEYLPYPREGDVVDAVNRRGEVIGKGRVVKVMEAGSFAKTRVVTLAVSKELAGEARSIRRL